MKNSNKITPRNILLYERDTMVRTLLSEVLVEAGYSVVEQDGVPHATSLRKQTPALVILDIPKAATRPELDFVSLLKSDSHTALIPILAMCRTYPSNDMSAWTQQRGIAGMLRKPFDLDEFLVNVETALKTNSATASTGQID